MPAKSFKALCGEGFVRLPFDVPREFGKARPPVKVTLNGYTYRSTVSVYGGEYFIPVRKDRQEAAGVKPGDTCSVTIALDNEIRDIEPPPDLRAALQNNADAKARWDKLSYTDKKEHARAILEAKKPGTRARRLHKTLQTLTAGAPTVR